ncbi:MAG TPA: macro domain-containing protein [Nitrospiraceae bacterium]|nr:macro domain-containing protein [Nitrospiraceae bacterium]
MSLHITVIQGSILDANAEVIVNAANSRGFMGGGVAGVIKRAAGTEVEQEAVKQAPIPVEKAVLTSGGKTLFKGIIHAPTMPEPGMRIPAENVAHATRAALSLADEQGFTSIAIPGMGTGVGGVEPEEAARHMVRAIRSVSTRSVQRVILVDVDPAMVAAWRNELT